MGFTPVLTNPTCGEGGTHDMAMSKGPASRLNSGRNVSSDCALVSCGRARTTETATAVSAAAMQARRIDVVDREDTAYAATLLRRKTQSLSLR